jgi:hypothetical protein
MNIWTDEPGTIAPDDVLRELKIVLLQYGLDLIGAHAEICRLQNLDPETHEWPEWTPQANSLRMLPNVKAHIDVLLAKATTP